MVSLFSKLFTNSQIHIVTDVGVDDEVLLIAKQQGLVLLLHLAGGLVVVWVISTGTMIL